MGGCPCAPPPAFLAPRNIRALQIDPFCYIRADLPCFSSMLNGSKSLEMDSDLVNMNITGEHHSFHNISEDFLSEKALTQSLLATSLRSKK